MNAATSAPSSTITAAVIHPDGTTTEIPIEVRGGCTLAGLQATIGCDTVSSFNVTDDDPQTIDAWNNDEGYYEGQINPVAQFVVAALADARCQPVYGTFVFTGFDAASGDAVSLHAGILELVAFLAGLANRDATVRRVLGRR